MPIQGFRRFRKHQVGVQSSFSSNTSATRVLPYRGAIDVDPALVIPDVDTGSLDPMLAPYAGAAVYGGTWGDGKLAYDDAPWLWALLLKSSGAPTGGGTAKTHTFQAASTDGRHVRLRHRPVGRRRHDRLADRRLGDHQRADDGLRRRPRRMGRLGRPHLRAGERSAGRPAA
jgi:hypothetical protein